MAEGKNSGYNPPSEEEYAQAVFEDQGDLVVNLSNIQELKFENLPKGNYVVQIVGCEFGMSKNSGAPMYTMDFEVAEGEYQGRKLRSYLSFSAKALPGTKANLMRMAPELVEQPFRPAELAANQYFTGKQIRVKVADKEGQDGEMRSQIVGFIGPVE